MRALGYFCSYVPEELLAACGFEAVRFEPDFSFSSSSLFPVPFCALCKSFAQWAVHNRNLAGFVIPLACDASRRTCETLQSLHVPVFPLEVPASSSSEAVQYFGEHLKALSLELLAQSGIPYATFEERLKSALEREETTQENDSRPALLLLGSHFALPVLSLLEARGFAVFADLPEKRPRIRTQALPPSSSPIEALARRILLERLPCPRFPGKGRRQFLKRLCRERSVRGVIIVFSKFCDPQLYEIGLLRRELSLPLLLLEHDLSLPLPQWETRLEAFLEMVSRA